MRGHRGKLWVLARSGKTKRNGLSSVLVAVGGNESDQDAVGLACNLLTPHKGRLYILYVIEVDRSSPVDAEIGPATARGEEVLKRYQELAEGHKFDIQAELLQSRRAGLAVVQEAVDKEVDAIVLGIPYREVHGSFDPGDAAPYVLRNAPCRVILWRDVMTEEPRGNGRGA